MNFFITGATGFIGSHVARQLVAAKHRVVALVRDPSKAAFLGEMGVRLSVGDITDRRSIMNAMEGSDGVFHIAGWYKLGQKDNSGAERINVEGTRNVLETMKELGIPKGVYTSTLGVFSDTKGKMVDERYRFTGKHISEYDRTKWVAHYEVAEPLMKDGLPLVIVLPGAVYGPGDRSLVGDSLRQYLGGGLKFLPKDAALCWAHVEDVAGGHILAMEKGKPGESYIIAGPPASIVELYDIAEKITGIERPKKLLSPAILKLLAACTSVIGMLFELPPSYRGESLRVVAGTTYLGDNTKARKELGYKIRPLEEGLRQTIEKMQWEIS